MNRWRDWWAQAERDLRHAEHSREVGDHEWGAFAAHQAAEKAVKALIQSLGGDPWGHSIHGLLKALPEDVAVPDAAREAAARLDKHYLPARYPNGIPAGHPGELYTSNEAETAIADAEQVVRFCRGHLPRS